MKILIFAIGSRGDVQPFVSLAKGLKAAGHEVVLSAPKNFTTFIAEEGLTNVEIPTDIQALMEEPEIQAAMNSVTGRLKAFRWATDIMNKQMTAIWQIGLEAGPDVILNHFKAPVAPHLAQRLSGVSIPVTLQPAFAPTRDFAPSFMFRRSLGGVGNRMAHRALGSLTRLGTGTMIRRWIKATGTDIGPKLDISKGFGGPVDHIHAYSPTMVARPDDWGPREVQPGYFFAEPEEGFVPDPALEAFLGAGPPPIYAGFGSMPGLDHARTTGALRGALERSGQRAVLATGWGGIDGFETGENIHVLDAVPHTWLFPRVAAVIHHGGSGTTHEGLRWGRPSVVCPLFMDQPFFGDRVAALGAGPVPIRQKHLTAENLSEAIEFALRPETAANAAAAGERIRAETAVADTVGLIERLA